MQTAAGGSRLSRRTIRKQARRETEAGNVRARDAGTVALHTGLAFVAFALGTWRLGVQSLGFDEGFSVYVARMPLADGLRYLTAWDAHPPLHYSILHYWIKLAGSSEFAVRLASVAAGVLVVPLAYQTGRTLAGASLGLLAALVTAPSPFLTYYSQQGRMYSLATLFALLAMCLTLRTLGRDGRGSRGEWLGLLAAVVLSLYTLYYTAFVLLSAWLLVIVWGWRRGRRWRERLRRMAPYVAVAATAGLLFLPWLPEGAAQARATGPAAWRTFVAAPHMLWQSWLVLSLGHSGDPQREPWLWAAMVASAAVVVAGALVAVGRRTRGGRWKGAGKPFTIVAAYLGLPLAMIQLASHVRPIYNERYIIVLLPVYALLVALGLTVLARQSRWLVVCGALLVFGGQAAALYNFYYDGRYAWDDYRSAVRFLQANLWPGDVILLSSGTGYPVFNYYFGSAMAWRGPLQDVPAEAGPAKDPLVLQIGTVSEVRGPRLSTPEDEPETAMEVEEHLASVARTARRVWYLRMLETITDRREVVHSWLDGNLFELEQRWFQGPSSLQLYLYTTRRPPAYDRPQRAEGADVIFSNGAAIVGYEIRPPEPRSDALTVLTVYWQVREAIREEYQTFAHVVDRQGQKWAQHDGPPLGGRYPTTRWQMGEIVRDEYAVRLPEAMPAGLYHFEVGMYELSSMRRVALVGDAKGDAAVLGEVVMRPAGTEAGNSDRPALATIGPAIALQGYRVDGAQLRPGGWLEVTLVWKALAAPAGDYKVFVHLIDDKERVVSQQDGEPMAGRFPTSRWRSGDVIEDHYRLPIPATARVGDYRLAIGLYEPLTLQRLAASGSDEGRVMLGAFPVSGTDGN